LTTLKKLKKETKIIFDDYESRQLYQVVEKFIKHSKMYFNLILFAISEKKNLNKKK
jgi:hypothetical protein